MTHEFINIMKQARIWHRLGRKSVLASVVDLDGSSYRKPGVRMLINDQSETFGAISGGCVEKEIVLQAQNVFKSKTPLMITYDGRLRLGCEGVLYVLLELIEVSDDMFKIVNKSIQMRLDIRVKSFYRRETGPYPEGGTVIFFEGDSFSLQTHNENQTSSLIFEENLPPLFRLFIIGGEHDAVQLCRSASQLGWEVHIVVSPDEQKTISDFPGAKHFHAPLNHQIDRSLIDKQTAVVLMTHSYTKDVYYLKALQNTYPAYFGLLGPKKRKGQLIDRLLEMVPDIDLAFIEQFHGPAGINIGAYSAQEISVSIMAEILAVTRKQEPILLKNKKGDIHA